MAAITDDYMKKMISASKEYTVMILRATSKRREPGVEATVWEHGRRNFELMAAGVLPIVCPVSDGSDVSGIGIFNAPPDEVRKIIDEDPAVKAGLYSYELHPCRGFPGSALPV